MDMSGTSLADWLESAVRREAIRSDASRLGAWATQQHDVRELHADWAAETERENQEGLRGDQHVALISSDEARPLIGPPVPARIVTSLAEEPRESIFVQRLSEL